ncbi:MAG: 1-acyl-sn-glycerol-3-phosphate acyltransferase [Rhizobiales bacterium]|nr:1-acyl-sn-glycerol-3-phosphate acyltransferase [Hyphomicrobiales bacterium]
MLVLIRSTLFTVAFFVATTILAIVGAPVFLLGSQRTVVGYTQLWGRVSRGLLRVLAGVRVEIRGREHIPAGPALVAAKHQSAFETFALLPLLPYPAMVMKAELGRIPLFGFYSRVSGMILVDRRKGATALRAMVAAAKAEAAKGRPVVIFPEGTRRVPGAPPAYQPGVALLYTALALPCVPVALDSGLFWPRRSFRKYPGTIVVEFLPPIPAGLASKTFLARLETAIEDGSDRLLAEAAASANPPPLPDEARERLASRTRA